MYTERDGYIPQSFDDIEAAAISEINGQFQTTYNLQTFKGSNFYKFYYGGIQLLMNFQSMLSAIYSRLVDFPRYTNERIIRPTCTLDGFMEGTTRDLGITTSLKKLATGEQGQAFICADLDNTAEDYDTKKQQVLQYEADNLTLGLYYNGSERGTITASNGQAFEYAFGLPTQTTMDIRMTITQTTNRTVFTPTTLVIQQMFIDGFNANYRLGYSFEPHRYLNLDDLPFAGSIVIEWSKDDGATWDKGVYPAEYDEKIILGDFSIEIV